MKLKTILLGFAFILFSTIGFSQATKEKTTKRQNIQKQRITQVICVLKSSSIPILLSSDYMPTNNVYLQAINVIIRSVLLN